MARKIEGKDDCREFKKVIEILKIMGKITDEDIEKAKQAINLFQTGSTTSSE